MVGLQKALITRVNKFIFCLWTFMIYYTGDMAATTWAPVTFLPGADSSDFGIWSIGAEDSVLAAGSVVAVTILGTWRPRSWVHCHRSCFLQLLGCCNSIEQQRNS
jgi:hypothetical protein